MEQEQGQNIIVVGGGLAGLAATIEISRVSGGAARVTLMDKEARLGGNSQKASSGVSALTPEFGDSQEDYQHDTIASGGGYSREPLVSTLVVSY